MSDRISASYLMTPELPPAPSHEPPREAPPRPQAEAAAAPRVARPARQINFYDRSLRITRDWLTAEAALGAMLASVAVVALLTWNVQRQTDALQAPAHAASAALEAQQADMLALTQRLAGLRPDAVLQRQLQTTQTTLEQRQAALRLLGDGSLGPERGYASALQAFARQSVDGLWLTGLLLDHGDVALRGRALRPELIPAYVGRLNDEPALQGHSFRALDIRRPDEPADAVPGAAAPPVASTASALAALPPAAAPATAATSRPAPRLAAFVEFSLVGSGGAALAATGARP